MAKRTALAVHVFVANPDLGTDHNGQRYCARCPLRENHDVHQMPEQPAAVTEAERRLLGERENGD